MDTECSVCMESFEREGEICPKLLPCSHIICLRCLRQLAQGQGGRVQCPQCRDDHMIPNVANCVTNRYIIDIMVLNERVADMENGERRAQERYIAIGN